MAFGARGSAVWGDVAKRFQISLGCVMQSEFTRKPVLGELYQQYLADQDTAAFVHRTSQRYTVATLARLAVAGERLVRRSAVLALGLLADYECNPVLGRALCDNDRGVRLMAETAIRSVWCRIGTAAQRQQLAALILLNRSHEFAVALRDATALIREAPWLAEVWNQRAIAQFGMGHFDPSIHDCRQALEINPYHFGAAAGMGQSYLRLGNQEAALQAFRRALGLNPELDGIRANVHYLERALKRKP
jgi:tetratricopeptide (TPR) repeat protein